MHELSIAQAIVSLADSEARREQAQRVEIVTVAVGILSGIVPDSLEFCFPAAAGGTLVEGAELRIERIEGVGFCRPCDRDFPMAELLTPCPRCGEFASEIRAGDELRVRTLDIV
ncbi:MAG: hydrogenase maturation nickel metallochaperone HypA [bacterium]